MPEKKPEGEPKPRMVKPPAAKGQAPKPKMVQAPSRRGSGAGRRTASAPKKKSPMPLVLGGLGVVVIAVVAFLVLGGGGDDPKKKSSSAERGGAKKAAAPATSPKADDPPDATGGGANVEDEIDRAAELAEEFRRKKTLAESDKDHWALATWCKENDLKKEMRSVAGKLAAKKDSKYAARAHRLLGHKLFDGEHPDYQDKWLTKAELKKAMEAEKEYQHRLATDPRFEKIEAAVKNAKYLYLRDVPHFVVREWPYVLFIEDFGTKERNEYYAAEKADQVRAFYNFAKTAIPGLIKKDPEIPYRVIVFKDGASYNKFNEGEHGGKGSGGEKGEKSRARAHFSLRTKFVYYYEKEIGKASFSRKATLGVLFHECTHQLLNDLRPQDNKASPSMWFEEAFAEYIGAVEKTGKYEKDENGVDRMTFAVGRVNSYRLPHIKMLIKAKRYFSLPEMFMCRTYEEANQAFRLKFGVSRGGLGQSLLYCQGWSFVYFCLHGADGKYRDMMIDYIKKDAAGDSFGYETLSESFGIAEDSQWDPIQREWLAYVRRLQEDGTLKSR